MNIALLAQILLFTLIGAFFGVYAVKQEAPVSVVKTADHVSVKTISENFTPEGYTNVFEAELKAYDFASNAGIRMLQDAFTDITGVPFVVLNTRKIYLKKMLALDAPATLLFFEQQVPDYDPSYLLLTADLYRTLAYLDLDLSIQAAKLIEDPMVRSQAFFSIVITPLVMNKAQQNALAEALPDKHVQWLGWHQAMGQGPDLALQSALGMNPGGMRDKLVVNILIDMFKTDENTLLERLLTLGEAPANSVIVSATLARLAAFAPGQVFEWLWGSRKLQSFSHRALDSLIEHDPISVMELLTHYEFVPEYRLSHIIEKWLDYDFQSALRSVEELLDDVTISFGTRKRLAHMILTKDGLSLDERYEWMAAYPEFLSRSVRSISHTLVANDINAAMTLSFEIQDANQRMTLVNEVALQLVGERGMDAATEYLSAFQSEPNYDFVLRAIHGRQMTFNIEEAAGTLLTQPSSIWRTRATFELARRWSQADPEKFNSWLLNVNDSQIQDDANSAIAVSLYGDVSKASEIIAAISDTTVRDRTAFAILKRGISDPLQNGQIESHLSDTALKLWRFMQEIESLY